MPQTAEQIQVPCACGKKLKAPASAVGKKAKCPGCGAVLTIKAPAAAAAKPKPAPAAAAAHAEDDGLGALYELAAAEKNARVDNRPRCPQCINEMAPDAVVCMNCGFNLKTGKALQTQKIAADEPKKAGGGMFGGKGATSPSGKPVQDAMAPQGSYMTGLAGSAIGGGIGGVVWFLIAWFTGYELGFIALGVGALAGVGMQMGQKGYSQLGGMSAAGIAFLAIVLAKIAVIAAVVMPALNDDEGGESNHDDRIVHLVASDEAKASGKSLEDMSYDDEEAVYKRANKTLDKMSPAEISALKVRADEEEKNEELAHMVAEEMHQQQGGGDVDIKKYVIISNQADKKVAAMTPQQRDAERTRLEAKFASELAANKNAEHDEDDSDGESSSGAGTKVAAAGFILLILLVVGWKSILFLIIAMSLAYKTAAGAVSG